MAQFPFVLLLKRWLLCPWGIGQPQSTQLSWPWKGFWDCGTLYFSAVTPGLVVFMPLKYIEQGKHVGSCPYSHVWAVIGCLIRMPALRCVHSANADLGLFTSRICASKQISFYPKAQKTHRVFFTSLFVTVANLIRNHDIIHINACIMFVGICLCMKCVRCVSLYLLSL